MAGVTLVPDPAQIELARLTATASEITAVMRACAASSHCPVCGIPTARTHPRYVRRVADLPWLEVPVRFHLQVRRLFCDQPACPRAIVLSDSQRAQRPPRGARCANGSRNKRDDDAHS
jgi:transposase